jgi:hypothetical protein
MKLRLAEKTSRKFPSGNRRADVTETDTSGDEESPDPSTEISVGEVWSSSWGSSAEWDDPLRNRTKRPVISNVRRLNLRVLLLMAQLGIGRSAIVIKRMY